MKYESEFHTSAPELGEIAARAKAKMLILTHWTLLGNAKEDDMVREIREKYSGPVVIAPRPGRDYALGKRRRGPIPSKDGAPEPQARLTGSHKYGNMVL